MWRAWSPAGWRRAHYRQHPRSEDPASAASALHIPSCTPGGTLFIEYVKPTILESGTELFSTNGLLSNRSEFVIIMEFKAAVRVPESQDVLPRPISLKRDLASPEVRQEQTSLPASSHSTCT